MFRYSICNQADESLFFKQCYALEKKIQNLNKEKFLEDVDGSKMQTYSLEGYKISVVNSFYTNELYIESGIDLEQFF